MTTRIESLEASEKNRSTEETKKAEEPEQPILMQTPLMLTQSGGGFAGAPVNNYIFYVLKFLTFFCYSRIHLWADNQECSLEWECNNQEWVCHNQE